MVKENKQTQVDLADISNQDLTKIKELEEKLGNKYFLIAYAKK